MGRRQNENDAWAGGSGPAHLAYHGALISRVLDGKRWQQWLTEAQYYTLNLSSHSDYVSEDSLLQYKIDGVLAALTIVHLLVEPHPISPFVIYAASVTGRRELRKSVRQLIGLIPDRDTRQLVSLILDFPATKIVEVSKVHTDPVMSRALELEGIQVSCVCVRPQVIELTLVEGYVF